MAASAIALGVPCQLYKLLCLLHICAGDVRRTLTVVVVTIIVTVGAPSFAEEMISFDFNTSPLVPSTGYCKLCDGSAWNSQGSSYPVTGSCTFTDPVPAGSTVTAINVYRKIARYAPYSYFGIPRVTAALNGVSFLQSYDISNLGNCSTTAEYQWYMTYTGNAIDGYVHGGANTLSFTMASTTTAQAVAYMSSVRVEIYYVQGQDVFIDIDDTFSAAAPNDEAAIFVPGTKKDGTNFNPVSMPQILKVHVKTPSTAKSTHTIAFELLETSQYAGVNMNWPLTLSNTFPDMDFGTTPPVGVNPKITQKVNAQTHINTQILYVRDYAATAKLKVTVPIDGKSSFTIIKQLPVDADGNKLPDAGWPISTGAANPAGLTAGSDGEVGVPPASGDPAAGILGDGLSAIEEYRGFVVGGVHRRLNPQTKDLFLVYNPADFLGLDTLLPQIPATLHKPLESEVVLDSDGVAPRINPNLQNLPAGSPQRGLKIRRRVPTPMSQDPTTGELFASNEVYGFVFGNGQSLAFIPASDQPIQSPNETRVVEFYPNAFGVNPGEYGDDAIAPGANGVIDSQVKECLYDPIDQTQVTNAPCDEFMGNLVYDLRNDGWQTTIMGDDYMTENTATSCETVFDTDPANLVGYTPSQIEDLKRAVVLHETGHGVDIEHNPDLCSGTVMTIHDFLPVPNILTNVDKAQVRTHRKY